VPGSEFESLRKEGSPEKSPEAEEKKSTEEEPKTSEAPGEEDSKMEVDEVASKAEEKSTADLESSEKESEEKAVVKTDEEKAEESKEESMEQTEDKEKDPQSIAEAEPSEKSPIPSESESAAPKKPAGDQEILDLVAGPSDPDDDEVMKEKEKAVEEECKKQAAELKARFPDLEVIQPATVKQQKLEKPKLEMCMIRWFKDFALERRIAHIVACVESGKWPVDSKYSAFASCKGATDLSIALHESIPHLSSLERRSTTPDVITITTDQGVTKHLQSSHMQQVASSASAATSSSGIPQVTQSKPSSGNSLPGLDAKSINAAVAAAVAAAAAGGNATSLSSLLPGMSLSAATGSSSGGVSGLNVPSAGSGGKKRKRHIAIDVETERAKLHALLNSSTSKSTYFWYLFLY